MSTDPQKPLDAIVATSTPPGVGALAVTRVSGRNALDVIRRVAPELPSDLPVRSPRLVRVIHPESGEWVDHALVTFFKAPASYTGEDLVEISGHGGWIAPALVANACAAAGARLAEPGEFTRRAYLHGKMDLVQAEGVLDLIEGRNRALHRAALHQVERGLSARIAELRQRLVKLEALLVHHLDFPEEDDPPVPRERITEQAASVASALEELLATAPEGELLRTGALVVLAGRPNTGKSSLFNALVGEERAIVTAEPGTTRDALEVGISLGGFPFRLVDTAGLRESQGQVERLGIEVAKRYLAKADVVVFCAEAGRELEPDERTFLNSTHAPVVVVRSKSDLAGTRGGGVVEGGRPPLPDEGWEERGIPLSVVSGEGLAGLKETLPSLVFKELASLSHDVPVLTRARQRRQLDVALDEVRNFERAVGDGLPVEVASTHLRPAESALEELLGVIGREDVLDELFREFCIGK